MEFARPCRPFSSCYYGPSSGTNGREHVPYNSYCKTTISVNNVPSDSMSAAQLQLPVRRPRRQELLDQPRNSPLPIVKPHHKRKRTTTTTTLDILRLMDGLGIPVDTDTYTSLIKECTDYRDATGAIQLLEHIKRSGLCPGLPFLNRILLMCVSCGLIENAHQLFEKMQIRDCNSWAAMIAGCMDCDNYEEMINLFIKMQGRYQPEREKERKLEFPVSWIIVCILKACVPTNNLELGKQIHCWLLKFGYDADLYLSSSLINLYGKFGCLDDVNCVFGHMSCRNTVAWTAKLVSNCREERFDEVINLFKEMGKEGVKKNKFTFSTVLRACSRMNDDGLCGQQVHASLIKLGFESNDFVQCGLVDMYAKCGSLKYAKKAFEMNGDKRSVACWNAMLTGFIQKGYCIEAIKVLYAMNSAGLQLRESLVNEVRLSCGSIILENKTPLS
ncbi:hypothetical protein NMG60_11000708 [Bertholletia excelsa]